MKWTPPLDEPQHRATHAADQRQWRIKTQFHRHHARPKAHHGSSAIVCTVVQMQCRSRVSRKLVSVKFDRHSCGCRHQPRRLNSTAPSVVAHSLLRAAVSTDQPIGVTGCAGIHVASSPREDHGYKRHQPIPNGIRAGVALIHNRCQYSGRQRSLGLGTRFTEPKSQQSLDCSSPTLPVTAIPKECRV